MDHKFNIGQGFEINVYVLVYHCLHQSWTHHCDIQVYRFIHSFKQRHVFFFFKFEILKKNHFHLNKISPLLWTLEPDFLWYLISFYKMWVYPTLWMNIRTIYDLLFEVEGAHLCLKVQLIHVLNSLHSITIVLDVIY